MVDVSCNRRPADHGHLMLLELPTSKMFGWQWGDVNNVVLSLPVDELRRNNYRNVRCDITN